MAKNKTTETTASVESFIKAVKDEAKRKDCNTLVQLIKKITGLEPKMWGPSIVGFGTYHYTYDSGREGDAPIVAFSPRASSIALYVSGNFKDRETFLEKLGKHKTDKGCVHIKTLTDVDTDILSKMIINHVKHMKALYPTK